MAFGGKKILTELIASVIRFRWDLGFRSKKNQTFRFRIGSSSHRRWLTELATRPWPYFFFLSLFPFLLLKVINK